MVVEDIDVAGGLCGMGDAVYVENAEGKGVVRHGRSESIKQCGTRLHFTRAN
jgi:hypothetical protein